MRILVAPELEAGRVRRGRYASDEFNGLAGAFTVNGPLGQDLRIISSGSGSWCEGWEHVSVSLADRTPTWAEMCFVKDLFWREDECVMQLHPPRADYVNHHPHCLHLWRPMQARIPRPPAHLVGPKADAAKQET